MWRMMWCLNEILKDGGRKRRFAAGDFVRIALRIEETDAYGAGVKILNPISHQLAATLRNAIIQNRYLR